jgi:hypothetical protein
MRLTLQPLIKAVRPLVSLALCINLGITCFLVIPPRHTFYIKVAQCDINYCINSYCYFSIYDAQALRPCTIPATNLVFLRPYATDNNLRSLRINLKSTYRLFYLILTRKPLVHF